MLNVSFVWGGGFAWVDYAAPVSHKIHPNSPSTHKHTHIQTLPTPPCWSSNLWASSSTSNAPLLVHMYTHTQHVYRVTGPSIANADLPQRVWWADLLCLGGERKKQKRRKRGEGRESIDGERGHVGQGRLQWPSDKPQEH